MEHHACHPSLLCWHNASRKKSLPFDVNDRRQIKWLTQLAKREPPKMTACKPDHIQNAAPTTCIQNQTFF
jgi:hypothetical protein